MLLLAQPQDAYHYLKQGNIIAYPTEAVYGLGCDPFNEVAVNHLLALKHRSVNQGLILLISDWRQLETLVDLTTIPAMCLAAVKATWPGPVTWIFPKAAAVPAWISGQHQGIAIRMSAHAIAHTLCQWGPLVSTSANVSGQEPARDMTQLIQAFPTGIAACVQGSLGDATQPSAIYNVISGQRLR